MARPKLKKTEVATPPVLTSFLSTIPRALESGDPSAFTIIFQTSPLVFSSPHIQALRAELVDLQYRSAIEHCVTTELGDDWLSLNEAVISYLDLILACDIRLTHGSPPSTDDEKIEVIKLSVAWFEKANAFLNQLITAYNHPKGRPITAAVAQTSKTTIDIAAHVDKLLATTKRPCTAHLLNTVLRGFNCSVSARERDLQSWEGKRAATISLASSLSRIYLALGETRLVDTILENLSAYKIPTTHPHYPRSHLATFHYYRGIHYLHHNKFAHSREALVEAYATCGHLFLPQRRRILIRLLVASAVMGLLPKPEVFAAPEAKDLDRMFVPLFAAIRKGHFREFRQALGIENTQTENTEWRRKFWMRWGALDILGDNCELQVWRNLLRKMVLRNPDDTKPDTIQCRLVANIANKLLFKRYPTHKPLTSKPQNPLFFGDDVDDENNGEEKEAKTWFLGGLQVTENDVEGVCGLLLEKGWVKGYMVQTEAKGPTLVLARRGDPWPKPGEVELRRDINEEMMTEALEGEEEGEGGVQAPMQPGEGRVVRLSGVKGIGQ